MYENTFAVIIKCSPAVHVVPLYWDENWLLPAVAICDYHVCSCMDYSIMQTAPSSADSVQVKLGMSSVWKGVVWNKYGS